MTPQEALGHALVQVLGESAWDHAATAAAILDALPVEVRRSFEEAISEHYRDDDCMMCEQYDVGVEVGAQQERERLRRRHIYLYHHEDGDDYSRRPGCAWCAFLADPEDDR